MELLNILTRGKWLILSCILTAYTSFAHQRSREAGSLTIQDTLKTKRKPVTVSTVDKMPVAKPGKVENMPVIKPNSNSRMPVVHPKDTVVKSKVKP